MKNTNNHTTEITQPNNVYLPMSETNKEKGAPANEMKNQKTKPKKRQWDYVSKIMNDQFLMNV